METVEHISVIELLNNFFINVQVTEFYVISITFILIVVYFIVVVASHDDNTVWADRFEHLEQKIDHIEKDFDEINQKTDKIIELLTHP